MRDFTPQELADSRRQAKLDAEARLQWRMDLIVRHAAESLVSLEAAAEQFKKAEAVLTKSD